MSTGRVIAVRCTEDGEVSWHAEGDPGANYHTLCGLSLDDDLFEKVPAATRQHKISCATCRTVFELAMTFRRAQFAS